MAKKTQMLLEEADFDVEEIEPVENKIEEADFEVDVETPEGKVDDLSADFDVDIDPRAHLKEFDSSQIDVFLKSPQAKGITRKNFLRLRKPLRLGSELLEGVVVLARDYQKIAQIIRLPIKIIRL